MSSKARPRRAGTFAQQRYERGLRNYRVKTRWILALVCGPFIAGGVAVLLLDGHPLSWIAGGAAGAFAAAWAVVRDEPPAYIEHWREGAEGERKTAKELKPLLQAGFHVVHDVQLRYGNYDHVVVGPSGVFLLETKNPNGVVQFRRGVPHVRRRVDPDAQSREDKVRPRALSAARQLNQQIAEQTGRRVWVQAAVVFWSDFPDELVDDGRCVFVHGSCLRPWLSGLPRRLDQESVAAIAQGLAWLAADAEGQDARSREPLRQ
jgi:Nuclease-related domain